MVKTLINAIRAEIRFSRAQKLTRKRQFDSAEKEYKEAIRLAPRYSGVYLQYGLMLANAGRLDEGAEQVKKAIELSPNNTVYRVFLGRILYDQGNLSEALETLTQCAEAEPENLLCKNLVSIVHLAQGEVGKAMEILSEHNIFHSAEIVGRLWTAMEGQLAAGAFPPPHLADPEGIELNGPFADWRRKRRARRSFADGLDLMAEGEYEIAACEFRNALSLDPTIRDGHLMLGSTLMELGELELAESELKRVAENEPSFWKAQYLMGKLKCRSEMYAEAIPHFEAALQPHLSGFIKAEIRHHLGIAQLKSGRKSESAKAFTDAAEADIGLALFRIQGLIRSALSVEPKTTEEPAPANDESETEMSEDRGAEPEDMV